MQRPTNLDVFIYLRKSRKDIEEERKAIENNTHFDTLDKHRNELLELVKREKHHVVDIFSEVVSGEYLSERDVAQEMLRQVEEGSVDGVVVMDLDRLGRGDMIDAGTIFRSFKYSETLIITPHEVINCNSEGAELLFGIKSIIAREELKQINKRLQGGRRRSARDGRSITRRPPYGYDRDEDLKLIPNPDQASVIKKIFELISNGQGRQAVVKQLDSLGYKPPEGDLWEQSTISYIIKNEVYLGHIVWGKRRNIKRNGKYISRAVPPDQWTRHDNAHEPIISQELFDQANLALSSRWRPPTRDGTTLTNPLAGIVKCGVCDRAMYYLPKKDRPNPQFRCINSRCQGIQKGAMFYLVEERLIESLRHVVNEFATNQKMIASASPDNKSNPEEIIGRKKKQIEKLESEIEELNQMRQTAYEMLERKIYTEEIFLERQKANSEKMKDVEKSIAELQDEIELEEHRMKHQKTIIPKIRAVLETYNKLDDPEKKNNLLKSVVEKAHFIRKKEWTKRDHFELEVFPRLP
ncbi:recombinase [Ammoniphilus oxalaticus]|uniref:Recombinase n=1 Tax=Ammoniphilus oxalaticus TaxID=66863 RepID=A0A419SD48_9BACL|nr:recombinase family protein [Ammoniphilus oxalaticus]RKD21001.1 recombinase [Ammoniphilus oxalaticus]